jgi:acetyl-CoA carboxylase carboxyltransferase component
VSIDLAPGDTVRAGQQLFVMEAMKMEHLVNAPVSGVVAALGVQKGDAVFEGHALAFIEESEVEGGATEAPQEMDLDYVRPDLAEVLERHAVTLDAARPQAVERRRKTGQRTARENIDDLCDPGTFVEHGALVLTPGTGLSLEEVVRRFPTDGMVTGVASVNGDLFGPERSRCVVLSYDYTVLAGTQGPVNHPKTDRMFQLAEKWMLPVVFFTEGGGGRAGTGGRREGGRSVSAGPDVGGGRPLDTPTFASMGRLSGLVPLIGINSGRCFAGNASLLGCCDVIIATANSNIGMGGPAMIEGGGLGVFAPEEVGPMGVQVSSGVVDIAVEDEAEAVKVARQYLSYFQGPAQEWAAGDQRKLRHVVPENRLRMYDVRRVIQTTCDTGSVLELRRQFGLGMVTAFGRIEGRPVGILANNPAHLAGAIDSDGSDKAARFMQLCDAFDIPLVVLCDTPGMMVGPEVEKTGLVRHCSRLFVTGANLSIPHFTVVLRKAYGLGAQAMTGGSFKEPFFSVAWPTGEFGGMGLEGQVKLGYRNELAAIEDPKARLDRFNDLVAQAYERGKALNSGVSFGVDDVIDPMDTRAWIANGLRSVPPPLPRREKKRPNVDTW